MSGFKVMPNWHIFLVTSHIHLDRLVDGTGRVSETETRMERTRRLGNREAPPGGEPQLIIVRDEPVTYAHCHVGRAIHRHVLRDPSRKQFVRGLVGVERTTWDRWDRGDRVPNDENLLRLALVAFVDPDEYAADRLRTPWDVHHSLQQAVARDEEERAYKKVFAISLPRDVNELSTESRAASGLTVHPNWKTKR